MSHRSRRRFLTAAGSGAVVALAGCAGSDGSSAATEQTSARTSTQTTDETTTDEQTSEDETSTTTNSDMTVVLHFSGEKGQQNHAVSNVQNLLADETTDTDAVALVANGPGVSLLTSDSDQPKEVEQLAEKGVSLLACQNSLDAKGMTEDDLLSGAETVPAGVGELTKLQAEGYGYIKIP
ncbi:DsrE family protein [Halorussus halophilus]|uniref:DsrE family protein n=1 Tax=Halorussus halophilus TaxID=2650975 RepID=UPI00130106BE|nr:DsrE family protein [Halorussus halophilus]